jgi:hypothetical protein
MMRRLARWLATAVIVMVALGAHLPLRAAAQDPGTTTALITSPVENEQLFGLVSVVGSAGHTSSFDSYTLEYNDLSDPNAPWLLVQPSVRQQVTNDVLGSWNTNVVPDGVYSLRLRVFLQSGDVGGEFIVTGLRVVNTAPTPLPTTAGSAGSIEATLTPGPSPTSPIQQPPSNSPATPEVIFGLDSSANTGSTSGGSTAMGGSGSNSTTRVNTGRIRNAFCTGVYWAIGLFIVMLGYIVLRGRLRPYTRRVLWQIQDDLNDDR